MSRRKLLFGVVLLAVFLLGLGAGFLLRKPAAAPPQSVRETGTHYRFISPLLFTKTPESDSSPFFSHLKSEIGTYAAKRNKEDTEVSVYVRDLTTNEWIGVNQDDRFSPGSLLKVATLIAVLRATEDNPTLRTTAIHIPHELIAETPPQTLFPPLHSIDTAGTYTVEELAERLMVDSDNVANHALYEVVGAEKIEKTYHDLLVPLPDSSTEGDTAREYSHLFRTLYNGTYLSRDLSEEVLSLLSQTNFKEGIVAGVPADTVVSHKFGVVASSALYEGKYELHDCGIVYHHTHPYFICVMTAGANLTMLTGVIQDISRLVWEEFTDYPH